jgi:hypothetical protein
MIVSNHGYNAYDINKKKNRRKGISKNQKFRRHWLAIWVWITNGINEVPLVPAFQVTLIKYPGLDS